MARFDLSITPDLPQKAAKTLRVMMQAALQAGEIVREGSQREQTVTEKGLGDLVSELDIACDRTIQDVLRQAFPDDPILSEELAPETSVFDGSCWVIDPIDGSSALLFHAGPDLPAVMIARLERGIAEYSVVYFPLTRELFYAVRGHGAYKGADRLQCSASRLAASWIELNQYGDARQESAAFARLRTRLRLPGGARLVTTSPPHSGSGVRIAEGRKKLAAVVHDNNAAHLKQGPWDVLPVALIVNEAGGCVINFAGRPYDAFRAEPFIVASSASLAKEIIAAGR